ncbi:MAG: MFS transporter [Chloroflexi bacterium]|nr:MFS transporter [Chloroflexota bacterium]
MVASRSRLRLALLWLAGNDLRITLLAVPPVLPLIHADLQLDEKGVAALSGLPLLLLGIAAVPGSLLIARLGARRALLCGLWLIGISSALRGVGPSVPILFGMTLAMGAGISISQPTFPALVRQWFPDAVARATGFWSNGLLVGELLAASLTLPLVLPLVGSWEAAFAFWAIPVLITAALLAVLTPHEPPARDLPRPPGMPDWRNSRMWRIGIFQSAASMIYFGANTFIPDYLHATNQADLVGLALTSLNGMQVPASAVIGFVPLRLLARRSTSYLVAGAILAALCVVLLLPGLPLVVAAGVFGFCAAYVLVMSFALPALLAGHGEVARLSAGTFAISYTTAFVTTLVAGAIWDASQVEASAFLPALAGAAIVVALGPSLVSAAASAE